MKQPDAVSRTTVMAVASEDPPNVSVSSFMDIPPSQAGHPELEVAPLGQKDHVELGLGAGLFVPGRFLRGVRAGYGGRPGHG